MAFYNCPSLAMSRQTMGSITLLPVPFSAQLVLTGMTLGQWLTLAIQEFVLISCSVCEGLKNDEITVAGNQWPLLVYADCAYDPEGPWEGLFWNKLLVWVLALPSTSNTQLSDKLTTPSNIYLLPQAQLISMPRQDGLGTLAFMVWCGWWPRL